MNKQTLVELRRARETGTPLPMLTCYDYTTAVLMAEAEVPSLLVGDSAAMLVLGHPSTTAITLDLLIELTLAVRRGHPTALLMADMPFGSYHASTEQGIASVCRVIQQTQADLVKLELAEAHLPIVRGCAAAGVAVVAHVGLRPQAAALLGGYRAQGRTEAERSAIVQLARAAEDAGAAALLLEAVPPEVTRAVVEAVQVPVIGCGSGRGAHGYVVVTPDLLGLSAVRPRFVPSLPIPPEATDLRSQVLSALRWWVASVRSGAYPAPEHEYSSRA